MGKPRLGLEVCPARTSEHIRGRTETGVWNSHPPAALTLLSRR